MDCCIIETHEHKFDVIDDLLVEIDSYKGTYTDKNGHKHKFSIVVTLEESRKEN